MRLEPTTFNLIKITQKYYVEFTIVGLKINQTDCELLILMLVLEIVSSKYWGNFSGS